MPELTIKYTGAKTLNALKELAKSLNFSIKMKKDRSIKGIPIIAGDANINAPDLKEVFSKTDFDAKKLRKEAWSRKW